MDDEFCIDLVVQWPLGGEDGRGEQGQRDNQDLSHWGTLSLKVRADCGAA